MTDTEKSPSEQALDLQAAWNPPATDNALAYAIGVERHESDTRATVSTDYSEHNRGISPSDDSVDASRLSEFRDDLDEDDEDGEVVEISEDLDKKVLQEEAEKRGLAKSGSKKDLVARIEEFDAEQAEDDEDAEGESDEDEDDDDEE